LYVIKQELEEQVVQLQQKLENCQQALQTKEEEHKCEVKQ